MICPVDCERVKLCAAHSSSNGHAPPTLIWQRATSEFVSCGPTSHPVIAHFPLARYHHVSYMRPITENLMKMGSSVAFASALASWSAPAPWRFWELSTPAARLDRAFPFSGQDGNTSVAELKFHSDRTPKPYELPSRWRPVLCEILSTPANGRQSGENHLGSLGGAK